MNILGIETSTRDVSVALINETKLIGEIQLALELRHAEKLLPLIDTLFKETRLTLSDLSGIAVSIGPGSFTGLRVGLATAKGLAIGTSLPLLPIPTLSALVAPFCHANIAVAPMIVSRKNEIYWALFVPQEGGLTRVHADAVASVDEAVHQLCDEKEVLFVGDAAVLFRDAITKQFTGKSFFAPIGLQSARASSVAQLGFDLFKKGEIKKPEEVLPFYLAPFEPKMMKDQK